MELSPLYRWKNVACTAVPFNAIKHQLDLGAKSDDTIAFKHFRQALMEFDKWTARGAEVAPYVNEPKTYAMYCNARARTAISALRVHKGCSLDHQQFAAYAALCAGLAHSLLPNQYSPQLIHESLGRCYWAYASRNLQDLGVCIGALRVAVAELKLGGAEDLKTAQEMLLDSTRRNRVQMCQEIIPDAQHVVQPRSLGCTI